MELMVTVPLGMTNLAKLICNCAPGMFLSSLRTSTVVYMSEAPVVML